MASAGAARRSIGEVVAGGRLDAVGQGAVLTGGDLVFGGGLAHQGHGRLPKQVARLQRRASAVTTAATWTVQAPASRTITR